MKLLKRITCTIISCISLLTFSSCSVLNQPHAHAWQNYLIKTPSCTEKGLLESLCDVCGEKKYEDLMPSGHNFQNGFCTVCGTPGYSEYQIAPQPMPENANNTAAWSLSKIYETAQKIGYFKDGYEEFLQSLAYGTLSNIHIDNLGLLHVTATVTTKNHKVLEIPVVLTIGKVSPTNEKETKLGNIHTVEVQNNQLILTYSDGIQASAGHLTGAPLTITRFGINPNNELVIYFSDNTIAFAGKVPEGAAAETQANFMYRQENNGYIICGTLKTDESILKIPVSHQGKPILSIDADAFKNIIDKTVSIVIPESISALNVYAFRGLTSSATLYFEGSYNNHISMALSHTRARAYFKGQWTYVNGAPTPNN